MSAAIINYIPLSTRLCTLLLLFSFVVPTTTWRTKVRLEKVLEKTQTIFQGTVSLVMSLRGHCSIVTRDNENQDSILFHS